MIWAIFFISLGLAAARNVADVELEDEALSTANEISARQYERTHALFFRNPSEFGDMRFTEEQLRQASTKKEHKWPNKRVPVAFKSGDFTSRELDDIIYAIREFNRRLRTVRFVDRQDSDRDYVLVVKEDGCWSYVGRIGGAQKLSLGNGCIYNVTIMHECMHALGFTHEHNRLDRDDYVRVLYNNIPQDWHPQYNKATEDKYKNKLRYQYTSMMHYPFHSPTDRRVDAFEFRYQVDKNSVGEGENDGATRLDCDKVEDYYNE